MIVIKFRGHDGTVRREGRVPKNLPLLYVPVIGDELEDEDGLFFRVVRRVVRYDGDVWVYADQMS